MDVKKCIAIGFVVSGALFPNCIYAGPVSGTVNVGTVRPYLEGGPTGQGAIHFSVSPSTGFCVGPLATGADWYIDLAKKGGKEAYAALLLAKAMNKQVLLELSNATGCTALGGYLSIQSIYLQ